VSDLGKKGGKKDQVHNPWALTREDKKRKDDPVEKEKNSKEKKKVNGHEEENVKTQGGRCPKKSQGTKARAGCFWGGGLHGKKKSKTQLQNRLARGVRGGGTGN